MGIIDEVWAINNDLRLRAAVVLSVTGMADVTLAK